VSGSPALIRLEPAALLDPRSQPTVEEESAGYEENQSEMGRAIPYTLCSWAQLFAEEHNLGSSVDTMNGAVTLLINWWDTLVESPWVDEFYQDMGTIRQWLNAAHNWRPPIIVGQCFECGGELRKADGDGTDEATCHGCRRIYDGPDLFKVRLQKNHDRIDELTAAARITPELAREYLRLKYPQHPTPRESTIRSWLTRGNVTTTQAGGIDIKSMEHWFITLRNQKQAQRRGKVAV
jgi:hypothetical protein